MTLTAMREESVSCLFGRELIEVRRAREATRKALFDWGLGERSELFELIVSEFVTNALRHGGGPIRVRISCNGSHLRIEVHDDGAGRPVRRPVTVKDESGHGLEMVDGLLAEEGGLRTVREDDTGPGKTVCASLCLAGGQVKNTPPTAHGSARCARSKMPGL
jgi:signal transduction histidine kinase